MNATDPYVIEIKNETRDVWRVLDTYPTERAARADFDRWGGKVAGRPLRVRERT